VVNSDDDVVVAVVIVIVIGRNGDICSQQFPRLLLFA